MSFDPKYNVSHIQELARKLGICDEYLDKSFIVGDDETEPKLQISSDRRNEPDQPYFDAILKYLHNRADITLLPESYRDGKAPLLNCIMDTYNGGILRPSLRFFFAEQELRFRGEMKLIDPKISRLILQNRDWTNKTISQKILKGISGEPSRDELDIEMRDGPRMGTGYKSLSKRANEVGQYLAKDVKYNEVKTVGAYPTVRNSYAFAYQVEIRGIPLFLVLEACDDRWISLDNQLRSTIEQTKHGLNYVKEFEFELKGIIGLPGIPNDPNTKSEIRNQIRKKLFELRREIKLSVPDLVEVDRSKSTFCNTRLPGIKGYPLDMREELEIALRHFNDNKISSKDPRVGLILSALTGNSLRETFDQYGSNVIPLARALENVRDDAATQGTYAHSVDGFHARAA